MTRSRKILLGFAMVLLGSVAVLIYDVSRKTTFPGAKKHANPVQEADSLQKGDSLKNALPPKTPVHQP